MEENGNGVRIRTLKDVLNLFFVPFQDVFEKVYFKMTSSRNAVFEFNEQSL